jgi:hypothetical protein
MIFYNSRFSLFFHVDKKPRLENVIIYSTKINRNDIKIVKMSVADLWQQGNKVRINNFGDKENKAHLEKVIKQQVSVYCVIIVYMMESRASMVGWS